MATARFFVENVALLDFHTELLKINIFKVLFLEGGRRVGKGVTKKRTLCTLSIMLTILDDLYINAFKFNTIWGSV